jgi:FixJ family two-component response regulator
MKLKVPNSFSENGFSYRTRHVGTTEPIIFVINSDESESKAIKQLLSSARYNVESFTSAADFLARPAHDGPTCLIVDVEMPRLDGFDLQESLIQLGREEQLVFISRDGDVRMCARAIQNGAVDFLPKPFEPGELLESVERALDRSLVQRHRARLRAEAEGLLALLTPRELEVMQLVVAGLLNKQIAQKLGIAEKTVKIHRGHMMHKLNVRSIAGVIYLFQNARCWSVDLAQDQKQTFPRSQTRRRRSGKIPWCATS